MSQAFKDLLASKKFWTTVLGVITLVALKKGVQIDQELYWGIVGLFTTLLVGQGLTDHGKARAESINGQQLVLEDSFARVAPATKPESGFVSLALLLTLVAGLAAGGFVMLVSSCATGKDVARAGVRDVVDCTTGAAKKTVDQFAPVVDSLLVHATAGDGSVDWATVKDATRNFAADAGGCVLATVVARALAPRSSDPNAPQSSPLTADPAKLRAGFEELRAQLGATAFVTDAGKL